MANSNAQQADSQHSSRPWYRRISFWLLFLFGLYSLLGWVVVPIVLEKQLVQILKDTADWDTRVDNIVFNPYALSLKVDNLSIDDPQREQIVAFDSLYVNFEALRSLGGTISLGEIDLQAPRVYLDIDDQGITNFQKAFASDTPDVEPEKASSEPVKLYFGRIAIASGRVNIADFSHGEEFNLTLSPLGLELNEFYTFNNEGGDYSLAISLGDNQGLNWQGQLGIAPFSSKGSLELSNIDLAPFWHYAEHYAPYWLHQGRLNLSGSYKTRANPDAFALTVSDAKLGLRDIGLATYEDTEDFVSLPSLDLGPMQFDLGKQSLSLGTLLVQQLDLAVLRDKEGALKLLEALENEPEATIANDPSEIAATEDSVAEAETETETETANNTKPETNDEAGFAWDIERIVLDQARVRWQDQSVEVTADIAVENINLVVKDLSHSLDSFVPYALEFSLQDSRHSLAGEFQPSALLVKGNLKLADLPLAIAQPYLSEMANVRINDGTVSLETDYDLDLNEAAKGSISAALTLDNLALSDTLMAKPLSGFTQLSVQPIRVELSPQSIDIDTVALDAPYGDVFVNEAGEVNLAQLVPASADPDSDETESGEAENEASENTDQPSPTDIRIGNIRISNGRFAFSDESQSPAYRTELAKFGGEITDISSDPAQKSQVQLAGNVDTVGKLTVSGTLNPLRSKGFSDLDIQVQNINLTNVSTYSQRYMGYPIEKGKLNLGMDYKIEDKHLDASNHIIIDSLDLGSYVDGPDASSLPLPLALGILKNHRGVIDVKLPISGDLDDPGFSLGNIIFTAFTNLITKAVASPFTILGSLIPGDEDISSVHFPAGLASLDAEEARTLQLLAEALEKRPDLNLEIAGIINEAADLPVLKQKRLEQALRSLGNNPLASREQLVNRWYETDQAGVIRAQMAADQIGSEAHLSALDQALMEKVSLDEVDTINLARDRANLIADTMTEQHGISPERIFLIQPKTVASQDDNSRVNLPFSINVR